jgi:hypothetical protein
VDRKKGETVGPAGGETGVPRCLAEVYKLPEQLFFISSETSKAEKS